MEATQIAQQRENELLVGTHGRSIYITKLDVVQKTYDALNGKTTGVQQSKAAIINAMSKGPNAIEPGENSKPGEGEDR